MTFSSPHEQFVAIVHALQCKNPGCACQQDLEMIRSVDVHCPVHDDAHPSFTVTEAADRVLTHCKAGCGFDVVSQALRVIGLWTLPAPCGLTLDQLAEAKRLSVDFIKSFGVYQLNERQSPAVAIPFHGRDGDERTIQIRQSLDGDRFRWLRGGPDVPYGLPKLSTILATGYVIIGEGVSDVWTGWYHSLPMIGVPSASTWDASWAAFFPENLKKYIWCEDAAGWGLVDKIVRDLPDALVLLPPEGVKDLSALHIADPETVKTIVARMIAAAKPASELTEERKRAEAAKQAAAALEQSTGLLDDPELMDRIGYVLQARGLVGDLSGVKLLYLMLTSRFLSRPVNGYVEGPPSVGKNYCIDCTKSLFPDDAYYELTSSSDRAAVFSKETFANKMVIISEVTGLSQDGVGASIIRELAWRGQLRYEITEKTKSGTFETRLIIKPGPTGFITTTTDGVEPQLETRMFPLTVSDTPEQTRLIVNELSRQAEEGEPEVDVSALVAVQRWLALAGQYTVIIPFAKALATLVNVRAIRMRRDFSQLLNLIRSSAILHQRQRPRDSRGRILATLRDYAIVYDLVAGFLGEEGGGLAPGQREAVEAIRTLQDGDDRRPVSVSEVAKQLRIDPRSVTHRIQKPLRLGYLVNDAERHRPCKLRLAEDPSVAASSVPTLRVLEAALSRPITSGPAPSAKPPETDSTAALASAAVENQAFQVPVPLKRVNGTPGVSDPSAVTGNGGAGAQVPSVPSTSKTYVGISSGPASRPGESSAVESSILGGIADGGDGDGIRLPPEQTSLPADGDGDPDELVSLLEPPGAG
ncbi:MAG TPA: hypothetical protein VKV57_04240 [bacterium]|nr:hypothetical protein [bacterium]